MSNIKYDGIVKSIKTVILRSLRRRIGLDWCVGLKRFFGRSSLRMTHTRLLPPKEGGQVTTFYEIVKYQIVGIILVIFMLLSNSACWFYSFKGTLPPHIKSVAIPVLTDRTAEFNIQQVVTDQIRIGFIQENILKLAEEDNAHSVLYGTIQSIQDRPLVFKESESGEAVTEYRLTLKVEVEWFDKVEKKAIFKKQFTGYSEYDPTGATDRTRELALEESVDQIIEDIINSILAGW